MFNSVSQRQTASWSIELNAFSKSRYARKSGAALASACSAGTGTPAERGLEARDARRCGTAGCLRSSLVPVGRVK